MTFTNRAAELRRIWPFEERRRGDCPEWAETWEAEQFANINEGLAEILEALAASGTLSRRAETGNTDSAGTESGPVGNAETPTKGHIQ